MKLKGVLSHNNEAFEWGRTPSAVHKQQLSDSWTSFYREVFGQQCTQQHLFHLIKINVVANCFLQDKIYHLTDIYTNEDR